VPYVVPVVMPVAMTSDVAVLAARVAVAAVNVTAEAAWPVAVAAAVKVVVPPPVLVHVWVPALCVKPGSFRTIVAAWASARL